MPKKLETKAQLVLEIEGTKITLDADEARELFNKLKSFLGESTVTVVRGYPVDSGRDRVWDHRWTQHPQIMGREALHTGSPLPQLPQVIC